MLPLLSLLPAVLPIAGQLLGGLFGGGQQQSGGEGAAQAAASPSLAQLAPLLAQVGQRSAESGETGVLGAALAANAAQPSIAADVGSSLAGAFLAQQLAQATRQTDPQAQAGLAALGRMAAQDPITQNQETVARQTVQAIKDQLGPELNAIKQRAQQQAAQVQATAEHREIVARDTFRRDVLAALARLEQQSARSGAGRRY